MSAGPAAGDSSAHDCPVTERMISDYCRKRVAPHLLPVHTEALRKFLIASVDTGVGVPRYAGKYDWTAMVMLTNMPAEMLVEAGRHIIPLLDAICPSVTKAPKRAAIKTQTTVRPPPVRVDTRPKRNLDVTDRADRVLAGKIERKPDAVAATTSRQKRQYTRRLIVEFPEPLWTEWEDVDGFADALNLHIRRHGDSVRHLFYAHPNRRLPEGCANLSPSTKRCAHRSIRKSRTESRDAKKARRPGLFVTDQDSSFYETHQERPFSDQQVGGLCLCSHDTRCRGRSCANFRS